MLSPHTKQLMRLAFKLNQPVDVVWEYLTDMQKYVSVHPVITRIDKTSGNSYLVYETLKVGFIPFRFTYPVVVESNRPAKTVLIRATVFKLAEIEMRFRVTSENGISLVDEDIRFTSRLPIKHLMQRIFKEQHTLLFKNIEASGTEW